MRARFQAQFWVRDSAYEIAEAPGETEWELTPEHLAACSDGWREAGTYERDGLRTDPAAPEWVRDWPGPFEVIVDEIDDPASLARRVRDVRRSLVGRGVKLDLGEAADALTALDLIDPRVVPAFLTSLDHAVLADVAASLFAAR